MFIVDRITYRTTTYTQFIHLFLGINRTIGMKDAIDNGIAFVDAIMKDYKDVPDSNGMKVLYDVPDLETGTKKNVILRNHITEPFWNRVYELSESPDDERYRVCVVGTSGIGKTATTAILIRLLLLKEKTIVYHIRTPEKSRWVYEFIPNRNMDNPYNVDVKVKSEKEFNVALTPSLVDNPTNYYIVDPGATNDNCNPDDQLQAHVILITSPHEQHWGGDKFLQCRGNATCGTFLYYPIWTLNELQSARTLIRSNVMEEIVIERYHQVGGIPGHIFAFQHTYDNIIRNQSDIVKGLTTQQLKYITYDNWKAILNSMHTYSPKMAIVGYANGSRSGNDFIQPNIIPISTKVFESICLYHKKWFWNYYSNNGFINDRNNLFVCKMLAILCRDAMIGKSLYTTSYKDYVGLSDKPTDKNIRTENDELNITLGGCDGIKLCDGDIMSAATQTENVLFYSTTRNLFDFIYRRGDIYYTFCVTLERRLLPDLNQIVKLANSIGSTERLHFYYVVPSLIFDTITIRHDPNAETLSEFENHIVRVLNFKYPNNDE
jgi:hypothetical protein